MTYVPQLPAFRRLLKERIGAKLAASLVRGAICKRREVANDVLAIAVLVCPGNRRLAMLHALAAQSLGLHDEAVRRWGHARQIGAKGPFATSRLAASLRLLGEHSKAQSLLDDALVAHPDDVRILTEAARLAQERHRPRLAASFWRQAIMRATPHADWLHGYGRSLLLDGDLDGAARVVAAGRRQYPSDLGLLALAGMLATAQQDWSEAVALWTEYRNRSSDDANSWEGLGYAVHGASLREAEGRVEQTPIHIEVAVVESEPMRKLMMRFESIGENCEMGLVQRRFGAEPLGLLRWNDVRFDDLIAALDNRFAGMGQADNTSMAPSNNGEWFVMDSRWGLSMHTFIRVDVGEADEVFKRMCRRICFLRDKLLDDLKEGKKTFVYRSSTISREQLGRLHLALREHGPVKLLAVVPLVTAAADFPGCQVGDVAKVGDGLYIGFLGQFASLREYDNYDIDFDTWAELFATVARLEDESLSSAAATAWFG